MSTIRSIAILPLLVTSAFAQDSVSRNADAGNGLPGDSLSVFLTSSQRVSYVVDLVQLQTSWRTTFGIAPIAKCGKVSTARFSALSGPSSISPTIRLNQAFPNPTYSLWTAPQGGVDTTNNNTALNSNVTPSGTASVFGVGFLEYSDAFAGTTPAFFNEAVGCLVAFVPSSPSRMYVRRIIGANNSSLAANADRSQFGYGAIDADGNLHFRADSILASSSSFLVPGDNLFRVRLPLRTATINLIDSAGASNSAAANWLLNNGPVTTNTPSAIPADRSTRPVLLASNLAGQFVAELAPSTLSGGTSHLAGATEHRGPVSYSPAIVFATSVGTGSILSRSSTAARNDSISLFGLDANGAVMESRLITLPGSIADACDSTPWPSGQSFANVDFRHYESQVTFRGGNGPVGVGVDASNRAVVAAVAYSRESNTSAENPYDAILVARFDRTIPNGPVAWSVAAWTTTNTADGKDILGDFGADGVPNTSDAGEGDGTLDATPIGRLASLSELPVGKDGPSMSAPMVDSMCNVWFVGSVALKTLIASQPGTEYTTALLRAVYDPATLCYKLELVAKVGDSFLGANSARRYRIESLGLADGDSIASEAPWSSSVSGVAWNSMSTANLTPKDPRSLGGLVLSARITYDVNNDALYQDPTTPGGNFGSTDEGYDVILLLANFLGDPNPACPADLDNDGDVGNGLTPDGGVDINDLLAFLFLFEAGDARGDLDNDGDPAVGTPDGGVDINDLLFFLARFEAGC